MEPESLRYTGIRRGQGRAGSTTAASPAALAESLYTQGYQTANVFSGDRICGQVFKRGGKREWWGEESPPPDDNAR